MALFIRNLFLGETISFRYVKRTANDRRPLVMVLTENYKGHLHGLNLRYVSPIHARQLNWFFQLPQEQRNEISPLRYQKEQEYRQRAQQEFERRKQEILQRQTGVIVKPLTRNTFGVSTWGPTPKQQIQLPLSNIRGAQEQTFEKPQYPQQMNPQEMEEQQRLLYIEQQAKMRDYIGNPYVFYHKYLKPMFGGSYGISSAYRKYNLMYIRNVRIVHGLERLYLGI